MIKKINKIIFSLVAFCFFGVTNVFAADVWDGTFDTDWYDATKDTFTLNTAEELAGVAKLVNDNGVTFAGKTVILGDNIDLDNRVWPIIGVDSSHMFAGNFDGANHIISGLTDGNGTSGALDTGTFGLFGYVANSDNTLVIQNLNLTNVNIMQTVSGKGVGALIGYAHENGVGLTVKNVTVSGEVEGVYHVGGVVGKTYSGGNILFENVVNSATISNSGYGMTGGIVGIFSHTGSTTKPSVTFKGVKNLGSVANVTTNNSYTSSNAMQVSGITGNIANAKDVVFEACENSGNLSSPGLRQMSGMANIEGVETLTFENCKNNGNLVVTNYNNYNTDVSSLGLNHIGGLFAQVNVDNKITIKGTNSNYGTIGSLDNLKVYSGTYAGGIFGSINWSQKDVAVEFDSDAKLINEGTVYARQYAGGIAGIYKAMSNITSGMMANYGDVITMYAGNNEMVAAGGIFGTIINLNTSALTNNFTAIVENSEITALGYGEKIHEGNDNAVAAGGFVGINSAYNVSNKNVFVKNSVIEAKGADDSYNQVYAGGVFGLIKLTASNPTIGSLENVIVNETKISGKYAGEILGAAYDSYSAVGRNLLNVVGNGLIKNNDVDSNNDAFDTYLGVKINKAYITLDITEKYTVSFETNGGAKKDDIMVDVYTKLNIPQDVTKEGYKLEGWYIDETLENKYDFDALVENDLVLYAKWMPAIQNPVTGDNILISIIIACVSLLGFYSTIMYLKKRFN